MCNELYHYGVPGMKWGRRKQKPVSSGRTRSAQTKSAATDSDEARRLARKKKAKKAAIVGAAVVGTALAAYGAYKLHGLHKQQQAGKAITERLLADAAFEKRTGLRPGEIIKETYDRNGNLVRSVSNVTTPRAGETIREVWDAAGNVVDRRRH